MSLPIHHMVAGGPRPVAPFSHAVEADGWIFVTGQMPSDPTAPDAPLAPGVAAQTRRVMENLRLVLGGLGLDFANVANQATDQVVHRRRISAADSVADTDAFRPPIDSLL